MFFNRSRKQLPDSENVPAGSVLAIVLSKLLYFRDEKTEAQGEKKSYRGSLCELVAELEPEPRSAPGPQPTTPSTSLCKCCRNPPKIFQSCPWAEDPKNQPCYDDS